MSEPLLIADSVDLRYPLEEEKYFFLSRRLSSTTPLCDSNQMRALRNISFTIQESERVAIIGANGSGKSTLCRVLSGVLQPEKGYVQSKVHVTCMSNESSHLRPDLTGWENALLLASLLFPASECYESIAREAIAFADLEEFQHILISKYSRGMRTRLQLAITSARASGLLILDEVFHGADSRFRKRATSRFLDIIDQSNACLLVTHSESLVRDLCQRVIVMRMGEVVYDGAVEGGLKAYEKNFSEPCRN